MMWYFGCRVTQKVAISIDVVLVTHFWGQEMLTLIRVGSLKMLHVVI